MRKYAVIVAAGSGSRMNSDTPKQFHLINNKPVLYYTIEVFLKAYDDLEIILVLPDEHISKGQEIIDAFFDTSRISICPGGRTRFHSVQNGLSLINEDSIVFVHDGVRCLLTPELVKRCYNKANESGSAIPVITSRDSVRLINGEANIAVDRNTVKLVQTPQTFHSRILLAAYKIDYKDKFTDEAMVVEAFGIKVYLTEGEENNIKITTPLDMNIAKEILSSKK